MPTSPPRPRTTAVRERTAAPRISGAALMFDLAIAAEFRAAGIKHLDDAVAIATRDIRSVIGTVR